MWGLPRESASSCSPCALRRPARGRVPGPSADRHPTVYAQHVPGDEARAAAEQIEHGFVELAGAPAAPERCPVEQEVREVLGVVAELGGHLGGEEPGGDR